MNRNNKTVRLVLSALFLALAYVLPFLTGQIPQIGKMLCPMHIPVLLCGFFCGWPWGLAVGFIAPLLRSLTLGMPPLFPTAVCMAFELAAYGAIAGIMYKALPRRKSSIYIALLVAMIVGRLVWGVAMLVCMGLQGSAFTFAAFFAGAVANAIPGIIIQIVLIPILVMLLDKAKGAELE
ncbi:MAG: ECF transporter S component [Oscillospiraceae bacterium]|nr:ECF transporter S component [Oscillospiraceae bacterium]